MVFSWYFHYIKIVDGVFKSRQKKLSDILLNVTVTLCFHTHFQRKDLKGAEELLQNVMYFGQLYYYLSSWRGLTLICWKVFDSDSWWCYDLMVSGSRGCACSFWHRKSPSSHLLKLLKKEHCDWNVKKCSLAVEENDRLKSTPLPEMVGLLVYFIHFLQRLREFQRKRQLQILHWTGEQWWETDRRMWPPAAIWGCLQKPLWIPIPFLQLKEVHGLGCIISVGKGRKPLHLAAACVWLYYSSTISFSSVMHHLSR